MTLRLIVEAIIYTVLYSAFLVLLFKKQGTIRQLHNYPPKIRQRAVELGITTAEDMTEEYHDYWFHWKWFFISLLSSLPLAAVTGGLMVLSDLYGSVLTRAVQP